MCDYVTEPRRRITHTDGVPAEPASWGEAQQTGFSAASPGLTPKPQSIAGLIPVSMVDWDGKLSAVIFLSGCNFRCPYCHNPELISKNSGHSVPWEQVTNLLVEKKGWIDGVVITGGEPTVNDQLPIILRSIKEAGCAVKLDTNGSRPDILKSLLVDRLVDYVAMDIKSSWKKYAGATRVKESADHVRAASELVVESGVDHEFRTTVVPGFVDAQDIIDIAGYLKGLEAKRYFLQQFNPAETLESVAAAIKPYPTAVLEDMVGCSREFLPTKLRGAS